MRVLSSVAALSLGLVVSVGAMAATGEEAQLIDSINVYRSKAQPCGGEASLELPPLNSDTRLALSPEYPRPAAGHDPRRLPDGQRAGHQPVGAT
ncbi:hypothetical protein O164_30765 [Pseudomonas taiwanensis SJ9]|uniref:Uncharacterized protein n=1 Tax=Pseudomonas taiwanensis SJ9 TaxID=1388762 RepID=V7D4U9_9PSED|nr:hypothetical protein O164_30765 [Pseudomonas taiwanensis SJ9]